MYKAKIQIVLKDGILDPQGNAVKQALHHLGFDQVKDVRMGKMIEISLDVNNHQEVESQIQKMCEKLLANPVIEKYSILSLEEMR
ncbi:MAG TPA: phosphoribosylformylglycinamidine synthase subunit PurS [Pseudothermotoga sp.]|nr:phosphoribosylformylglycinamidine synthase subunit PurS [Pseudothermotoga sp.]HOK84031.1 phosphoribosylformylglycinamidine synthase subunit PurS [Pseudothermotoga sp.]HPP70497.1 phosphoribosylformylglycinamidine synthase subunit PurS [Pseudothermotoga sp.]